MGSLKDNLQPLTPQGTVSLCRGVRLDRSYSDTILFTSKESQRSFFSGKEFATSNAYVPLNLGAQTLILKDINADSAYQANYMYFQNSNNSNKYFYAFITKVSWISMNSVQIDFEIDVFQSWLFDFAYLPCFVEREHSATDELGDNTVDEGISVGEYETSAFQLIPELEDWVLCIADPYNQASEGVAPTIASGRIYSGIYSQLQYHFYNIPDDIALANVHLTTLLAYDKLDSVVGIYLVPKCFTALTSGVDDTTLVEYDFEIGKSDLSLGSYTPKNKKMYTSPFTHIYVNNNQGTSCVYKQEFFETENCHFKITGDVTPTGEICLIPRNYNGNVRNYNEVLKISEFPKCSVTVDSYKAYIARNRNVAGIQGALAVGGMIGSAIGGNIAGIGSGAMGLLNIVSSEIQARTQPDHTKGVPTSAASFSLGLYNFHFYYQTVARYQAESIDNFFTLYGYATKKVKVPAINNRPVWNYIQTKGCKISGNIPNDAREIITKATDNGITWWKNGDTVGNYSLDNSLV